VSGPDDTDRSLRPALFLDRDGVINEDPGWISSPSQLTIYPFAAEAIGLANRAGFVVLVISNQSVVARGLADVESVHAIHSRMNVELGRTAARIDGFYFCPHHPDFSGPCRCRKPEIGLIEQAAHEHAIDLDSSFFVGDATSDVMAGRNAGLHTVLVETGKAGGDGLYDVSPDSTSENLLTAVREILAIHAPFDDVSAGGAQ
jgi:histidinol-phosphate phosphatase family protein